MLLIRSHGGWKRKILLLFTFFLLITDVIQARALDEVEEVETGVEEDQNGGGEGGVDTKEEITQVVEPVITKTEQLQEQEEPQGRSGVVELGGDRRVDEDSIIISRVEEEEVVVVAVENGTSKAVVLDCPYNTAEEDLLGLHINWYHSSSDNPVYVWIPDNEPQALRMLRDRVDLTYEASTEHYHRHRALRILNPTTELEGRYVCRVNTFAAETVYTLDLIVFTEPRGVEVRAEEHGEKEVTVTCKVEEVYPQPQLILYRRGDMRDSEELSGATPVISSSPDTYSMQVQKVLKENTLSGLTEFECHVAIPRTDVLVVASTRYQPRVSVTTGAVTGEGSSSNSLHQQASPVLLLLLLPPLLQLLLQLPHYC